MTHILHEWRFALRYNGVREPPSLLARCAKCRYEVVIRPDVVSFAGDMESVLKIHDATKGDSWKTCSFKFLVDKLLEEAKEVREAYAAQLWSGVAKEAIDTANLAMMVHTRAVDIPLRKRSKRGSGLDA